MFGGSSNKQIAEKIDEMNPLASHSLLLLLVFSFHFTKEKNPYREAVFSCQPGSKTERMYRGRNNSWSSLWRRDFSEYFQPIRLKIL